jgi:hypothetical protein
MVLTDVGAAVEDPPAVPDAASTSLMYPYRPWLELPHRSSGNPGQGVSHSLVETWFAGT